MKVLGVDNVFLQVGDLARAEEFYSGILGLSVARRFETMGSILFRVGAETPGLGVGVAEFPSTGQKVWFEVADARASARELGARGVVLLGSPFPIPTGWAFEIEDPWGNVLGLTDYSAQPALGRV